MRMMTLTALVMLALAAGPAAAQDDLAERQAVAKEYLALSIETMDFDALTTQMSGIALGPIAQHQPELYARKKARLTEIVEQGMADSLRQAMIGIDRDMAENFTLAELTALRDFYASPEGRSVMTKMPAYMAEVMPRILQISMRNTGPMIERLQAEGVE